MLANELQQLISRSGTCKLKNFQKDVEKTGRGLRKKSRNMGLSLITKAMFGGAVLKTP